jgi:hypothetical protein
MMTVVGVDAAGAGSSFLLQATTALSDKTKVRVTRGVRSVDGRFQERIAHE